jgi:hypothetical protein
MFTAYLVIAFLTAAGVLAACDWFGSEVSPVTRESMSALVGVLWPLVLIGAVELLILLAVTRMARESTTDIVIASPVGVGTRGAHGDG